MKLSKIKNKLLNWRDFYGQDISDVSSITNADTKEELREVLQAHRNWLEDQNSDALQDLDNLEKKLGLEIL